jgi:type III secretion protein J
MENISAASKEYVRIWSMVMSKESAAKFRSLFFTILLIAFLTLIALGWLVWKVYPIIRTNGGVGELLNPIPLFKKKKKGSILDE